MPKAPRKAGSWAVQAQLLKRTPRHDCSLISDPLLMVVADLFLDEGAKESADMHPCCVRHMLHKQCLNMPTARCQSQCFPVLKGS